MNVIITNATLGTNAGTFDSAVEYTALVGFDLTSDTNKPQSYEEIGREFVQALEVWKQNQGPVVTGTVAGADQLSSR